MSLFAVLRFWLRQRRRRRELLLLDEPRRQARYERILAHRLDRQREHDAGRLH